MEILVTGASGFIGSCLIPFLSSKGHSITALSRHPEDFGKVQAVSWEQLDRLDPQQFQVVINLAGENIAGKPWTAARKKVLQESRILRTQTLVHWLAQARGAKPRLFNASAIGIYPDAGPNNTVSDESTKVQPLDQNAFSQSLVAAWEAAALAAQAQNIPVTLLRFGVVLKRGQVVLKKLQLPFSLGLGTIIGSGLQPFSWIDIEDLLQAIDFLIQNPSVQGPVNICSPETVSQKEFAQTLARVMKRPLFLKLPEKVVKLLFGQMGQELLLSGPNVYPRVLLEHQFKFQYANLERALSLEWPQAATK